MLAASLNAFFCASPIYGSAEDFTFLLVLPGIPGDFLQTKLEQIHTAAQMASVPGYSHFRISLSIGPYGSVSCGA